MNNDATYRQKRSALAKARAGLKKLGYGEPGRMLGAVTQDKALLEVVDALIDTIDALDKRLDEKVDVFE